MNNKPQINLPAIEFKSKVVNDQTFIWDALRGKYLLLTPEERVRQHVIAFLISHCGVVAQSIAQEYPIELNGTAQRADIVVIGNNLRPYILVECKAPEIDITQEVWAQAVRYNSVLNARYIILSNGHKHICAEWDGKSYKAMQSFPTMQY
ncbi:MAG: type I restriction enzyme HsdR N-terminal domain-containing protein [Alistipes sp.]|nr:type I restriction enzyme HsdR N-terminal domain-containing protein [Alistipes sp.]